MNILSTMLIILLGIILAILILFARDTGEDGDTAYLAGFLAGHAAGYFDLLDWLRENGKIDDNTYSRLICSVE